MGFCTPFVIPDGLHKITHDAFLKLDSYYLKHASLLIEDNESIIDSFIYCVNRNDKLLKARNLERNNPDDNTNRTDMDVVMDESSAPRATNTQENNALSEIPLSFTEVLMDSWKPILQALMQQFIEFLTSKWYSMTSRKIQKCAKSIASRYFYLDWILQNPLVQ